MSIPRATTSSPINAGHVRPANPDGQAPAQPTFSRKPAPGPAMRAEHVGRPQPVKPTPYLRMANMMCVVANKRHDKLESHFHTHPYYFGRSKGAEVFYDKEAGSVVVQDLNLKTGLGGIAEIFNPSKESSTCVIKPNGEIYFNGKLLTPQHPQEPEIVEALEKVSMNIRDYAHGFTRSKVAGFLVTPPWDPASKHNEQYVASRPSAHKVSPP